ncbi:oxoglutarate/malate carrier protein-like protein [Leptotrombidium deliense]|uniref:Oxoglutarate/malate carrier protein-like protein n=1 Tax=Leptotrombidium deliense TaxID=299467 RepID=A0A443SI99_9ACAR|nr:oxoglutarate/malate carrier protein-like protein [Leptotrombidium deliense]
MKALALFSAAYDNIEKPNDSRSRCSNTGDSLDKQCTTQIDVYDLKGNGFTVSLVSQTHSDTIVYKYVLSFIAASAAELVTYPLDLTKTRLQLQGEVAVNSFNSQIGFTGKEHAKRGMLRTAFGIVKEEGFFKLWRGLPPAINRHIRVFAGGIAQFLASPADLVKVQVQAEGKRKLQGLPPRVRNSWHAFSKIFSEAGVKGLWKGWVPNVQRAALVNLGDLTTYDTAKRIILKHSKLKDNYFTHALASTWSGFIAAAFGTPADTIKTRIMNQPCDERGRGLVYKGSVDCFVKCVKQEGFLSLYKGFIPCWMRMGPWSLTFWIVYERLRNWCGRVPGQNRRAIYAVGVCDHVVCYECSTKLRVLCKQNECPICRRNLQKVVYTCDRNYKYDEKDTENCVYFNNEHKIYFQKELELEAYGKLLENKCCICKLTFKDLPSFEKHLHKEHNLYLCELCVEHLKVFSHERKYYSKRDLNRHKKIGDVDDKSHRGHPICIFCETRFFDEDFLHRHLRRDHYYCHICDPGGLNKFFGTYPTLRDHFKSRHFLCEEGTCAEEQFTTVFKSEIDLQAHKAKTHCHTKSELKSARILALDLLIKPQRHRPQASHSSHSLSTPFTYSVQKKTNAGQQNDDLLAEASAIPQSIPQPDDFPELSTAKNSSCFLPSEIGSRKTEAKKSSFSSRVGGGIGSFASRNNEEFPALSSNTLQNPPKTFVGFKRSMSSVAASLVMKGLNSKTSNNNIAPLSISQREPFSTVNVINYCDHSNSAILRNAKDFSVSNEEFPALPVKHYKNKSRRKKKNAVNGNISDNSDKKPIENGSEKHTSGEMQKVGENECRGLEKKGSTQYAQCREPPGLNKVTDTSLAIAAGNTVLSQPPPGYSKRSQSKKPDFEISLMSVAQQVITKSKDSDKEPKNQGCKNSNFVYMQPVDFNERNQALVQEVSHILKEKFDFFKQISKEFRQGDISGDDYWKKCLNLFGKSNFSKIFGELLVLLPDIQKQNELLSLYENFQKQTKGAIPKRMNSADGLWIVKPDQMIDVLDTIIFLLRDWFCFNNSDDCVVVFCCIYSKGTYRGECLYNNDPNACGFGKLLGGIGFLASIALLVIEALFQNLSSIKMRRRVVAFDLAFSAAWSAMFFICFVYLEIAWNQSSYPQFGYGINRCAYFAWLRWKSGADMSQFAAGYETEDMSAGYASYAAGADGNDVGYQEGMYTGAIDQMQGNYSVPTSSLIFRCLILSTESIRI